MSQGVHKVVVETFVTHRFVDGLHYLMLRTSTPLALLYPTVFYNAIYFVRVCLVGHPEDPGSATARGVGADVK